MKNWLIVVTVFALVSCAQEAPPEDAGRIAELEKKISEQNKLIDTILLEVSGPREEGGPACPSDIDTWVHRSQGTSCDNYEAHIRGWSIRCVTGCDEGARLAEATTSAEATCKAFCDKQRCPHHRYMAPSQCAAHDCFVGSKMCPAQCPDLDSCFLEQDSKEWNCFCQHIEG